MKRILLAAVLLFSLNVIIYAGNIAIYHTSDTHGFFYPKKDHASGQMIGGFAAAKNVLNRETLPYLLLDGGDFLADTLETKQNNGRAAIEMMNALGYHATVIGNHETDYGEQNLLDLLPLFNFTVLGANITWAQGGAAVENILPYKIFDLNGVKIAVIGIGRPGDNKKLKFAPYINAISAVLPQVEKQKPDVVVLLIHDAVEQFSKSRISNLEIAQKFDGRIHVILGGDAHQIQNRRHGGVLLVESGANLKNISRVLIETDDKTGKFKKAEAKLIELNISKTGEDAQIKNLAAGLRVKDMDEVISFAPASILKNKNKKNCDDSALNNFIADAVREYASADIAVHNSLATRENIYKGNVTKRDVYEVFPFEDTLVTAEVDGAFIRRVVYDGIKQNQSIFTYSGLSAQYKYRNGRVRNLQVFINGAPLKENKIYKLATNSYNMRGYGNSWRFKQIPAEKANDTQTPVNKILTDYISKNKNILSPEVCRLKRIN